MRESIGATWIFTICLTFIILMTAYLAISVNYAKAFKIKSYIVSEIEENEGYDGNLEQQIRNYLTAQGYTAYGTCDSTITVGGASTDWKRIATIDDAVPTGSDQHNACIYTRTVQTGNDDIDAKRSYYRVVVFFKFDLPVVNFLTTFKVGGETGYIYDTSSNAHRNPISTKGTAAPTTARPLTTTRTTTTRKTATTRTTTTRKRTTTKAEKKINILDEANKYVKDFKNLNSYYECDYSVSVDERLCRLTDDAYLEIAGVICSKTFSKYQDDLKSNESKIVFKVWDGQEKEISGRSCPYELANGVVYGDTTLKNLIPQTVQFRYLH